MKVFLNHQEICVGSRVTLRDLLAGQSITSEDWPDTFLANGDKVTVIRATCGG